jgi:hypothetical protein
VVTVDVRQYDEADRDAVLELSLRAWEPVFDSLRAVLGPSGVFDLLHPDWRVSQRRAVGEVLDEDAMTVWVAVLDAAVVGFAAARRSRWSRPAATPATRRRAASTSAPDSPLSP